MNRAAYLAKAISSGSLQYGQTIWAPKGRPSLPMEIASHRRAHAARNRRPPVPPGGRDARQARGRRTRRIPGAFRGPLESLTTCRIIPRGAVGFRVIGPRFAPLFALPAAQRDNDERGQRVEPGRIVRGAGLEWQRECRAMAGLSSKDEETRQLAKRQQNQRGRTTGTHSRNRVAEPSDP